LPNLIGYTILWAEIIGEWEILIQCLQLPSEEKKYVKKYAKKYVKNRSSGASPSYHKLDVKLKKITKTIKTPSNFINISFI
jgi:hypothetical protein